MKPRLVLVVLVLALVAVVSWVYADQVWGGRGSAPAPTGVEDGEDVGGGAGGEAGAEPARGETGKGADERTVLEAGAGAGAGPAHTSLRGIFVSPRGVWPGGGRVALFAPPRMPEGGAMGLFSQGMQLNRLKQKQGEDQQIQEQARKLESLLEPGEPVRSAELDRHGGFLLHDPPAGTFLVRIQHPHLIDGRKVEVEIERGTHLDLGRLPTRLAGSLLVLVADPGGRPVAGAHLELHKQVDLQDFMKPRAAMDILGMIRSMVPRSGRTDRRGAHLFEALDPETSWTLSASSRHLVDATRPVAVPPGARRVVRVELSTGAELELRVVDPQGKPRPGARMEVTFPDLRKPTPMVGMGIRAGGDVVSRTCRTDARGRGQLDGLAPGRCVVELREVGFLRQKRELVLEKDEQAEVEFRLDPGATISGQVVDEEGQPVPGARVMHTRSQGFSILGMGFSDILDQVQTLEVESRGLEVDEEGRFVLGGMQPDESVQLMAAAPGFDGQKTRRLRAGAKGVVIQLRRRAQLAGVVREAGTREPVSEFAVRIQKRSFMVLDLPLVTEEFEGARDGRFLLEDVPRGRYEVVVGAEGRADWSQTVDFGGGGKVELGEVLLERPAAVAGVVRDPDGAPVARAQVRAGKGGQLDSIVVAQMLGRKVVKTDAAGRFRLEGVSGRRVRLLVDKEGFAPLRSEPVEVRKGATTEGVELVLSRGGRIRGRLVNGEGKPLPGWIAQATHTDGLGVQMDRTGADGGFVLPSLAPGTHKLDCMPGDYMSRFGGSEAARDLEEGSFNLGKMMTSVLKYVVSRRVVVRAGEEAEVEVVFHEPEEERTAGEERVTVDGRVRVGGRDLEEGMVFLFEAGATVQSHLAHVRDGVFRLRGVRPGHYRAQVQASVFSGPLGQPKRVRIPEGASHVLTLDLPAGRLAGRVVYAGDGRPAGGVVLSLRSATDRGLVVDRMDLGEGTQIADSNGRFRFEGLGAGSYRLLAKEIRSLAGGGGGSTGRLDGLRIEESEQLDGLVLQIREGGRIRVKVADAAGPRANALVTLLAADGRPMDLFHRALTEPDGTVILRDIPAGSYRVNADAPRSAAGVSAPVQVQSGVEREVTVQLAPGIPAFLELGKTGNRHAGEVLHYSVWRGDGVLVRSGRLLVPRNLEASLQASKGRLLPVGTLEPGRYRLRVSGPRLGTVEAEREVPAKGAATWKL